MTRARAPRDAGVLEARHPLARGSEDSSRHDGAEASALQRCRSKSGVSKTTQRVPHRCGRAE